MTGKTLGIVGGAVALLACLIFLGPVLVSSCAQREANEAKKHVIKAISPATIDSAARVTGHLIYEVRQFKKKVKMEVILEDSAKGKQ